MKPRLRYINCNKIFSGDEFHRVVTTLRIISDEVPKKYTEGIDGAPLPVESMALLKCIVTRYSSGTDIDGTDGVLWQMMMAEPGEDRHKVYSALFTLEAFCRTVIGVLTGTIPIDRVLNDFVTSPFRQTEKKQEYLVPQAGVEHELMLRLKEQRNRLAHQARGSQWRMMHLMTQLAVLNIVRRFQDELEGKLLSADDFVIPVDLKRRKHIESLRENPIGAPLRRMMTEDCRAVLSSLFNSDPLSGREDLWKKLPHPRLSGPVPRRGLCVAVAPQGSGKSVELARMVIGAPPDRVMLYVPSHSGLPDDIDRLIEHLMWHGYIFSTSAIHHYSVISMMASALVTGNVTLVIDTDGSEGRDSLALRLGIDFALKYPRSLCVVGVREVTENFPPENLWHLEGFDDEELRQALNVVSDASGGVNISRMLYLRLMELKGALDITRPDMVTAVASLLSQERHGERGGERFTLGALLWRIRESGAITGTPLLNHFNRMTDDLLNLSAEVYKALYTFSDADLARSLTDRYLRLRSREESRLFFELCEVLAQDRTEVAVTATVAASAMASDRSVPLSDISLRSGLLELADMLVTVPLRLPADSDRNKANREIIYRPSPKFILSRTTVAIMRHYEERRIDVESHPDELNRLFKLIGLTGTGEVYDELFRPYWLRQWAIDENEAVPGTDMKGLCNRCSKHWITLSLHASNPVEFLVRSLMFRNTLRLRSHASTKKLLLLMMRFIIQRSMTDLQRVDLLDRLASPAGGIDDDRSATQRLINIILISMDHTSNVWLYRPEGPLEMYPDFETRVKVHAATPQGRELLLKIAEHLVNIPLEKDVKTSYIKILVGLLSNFEGTDAEWRKRVLTLYKTLIYVPEIYEEAAEAIRDSLPYSEMDRSLALSLFDPPVVSNLLCRLREVSEARNHYTYLSDIENARKHLTPVRLTAAWDANSVTTYDYTIYSRPSPDTLLVWSRSFTGSVVGKYASFVKIGRMAKVKGLVDPLSDWNTERYAVVTLNLAFGKISYPGYGSFEIISASDPGERVSADAVYDIEPGRTLRLRVHGNDDIDRVCEWMRRNQRVDVGQGILAVVSEVEEMRFPEGHRMLLMDFKIGNKTAGAVSEIDETGELKFYQSDSAGGSPLLIYQNSCSETAPIEVLDRPVVLGKELDFSVWTSPAVLNRGTFLVDEETGEALRVEVSFPLKRDVGMPEHLRQYCKKEFMRIPGGRSGEHKWMHRALVKVAAADGFGAVPSLERPAGVKITRSYKLKYITTVYDLRPEEADFSGSGEKNSVDAFTARIVIEDENVALRILPGPGIPTETQYIRIAGIARPFMVVKTDGDSIYTEAASFPLLRALRTMGRMECVVETLDGGLNACGTPVRNLLSFVDLDSPQKYPSDICLALMAELNPAKASDPRIVKFFESYRMSRILDYFKK